MRLAARGSKRASGPSTVIFVRFVAINGFISCNNKTRIETFFDGSRQIHPIDIFFDSLAVELGERAIGVVLSGTGSDGALGLKAIKARGGLTLVQGSDGTAPQHSGMPMSAIATGAVDVVASVEAIPGRIIAVQPGPLAGVDILTAVMTLRIRYQFFDTACE
jgi:hypothetical protein